MIKEEEENKKEDKVRGGARGKTKRAKIRTVTLGGREAVDEKIKRNRTRMGKVRDRGRKEWNGRTGRKKDQKLRWEEGRKEGTG